MAGGILPRVQVIEIPDTAPTGQQVASRVPLSDPVAVEYAERGLLASDAQVLAVSSPLDSGSGAGVGALPFSTRTVTADTTARPGELLEVDATAGEVEITPPASPAPGTYLTVLKVDDTSNRVLWSGAVNTDPDGAAIVSAQAAATFVFDGVGWVVESVNTSYNVSSGGASVPDATTTVKGRAKLLGGTADAPTVPYGAVTGAPTSLPPSGGAGGVLSGSYPNPGFAVDMATQAELDAVAAAKAPANRPIRAVSANTTAVAGELLKVDASGATRTVTPPASPATGAEVIVMKTDATSNAVVWSGTVDGDSQGAQLVAQWAAASYVYDGTQWLVRSTNLSAAAVQLLTATTTTKTANYTAASGELVPVDTTGGAVTVTSPSGGPFAVRWKAGSTGPTVTAATGFTINGAASATLSLPPSTSSGELVVFQCFGADYQQVAGFKPQGALNAAADTRYQPQRSAAPFTWPRNLVAFWDFHETAGTSVTTAAGAEQFAATMLSGGTFAKSGTETGPFGAALTLDGSTTFVINPAQMSSLDVSRDGDQVTVVAWVKDTGDATSFRAGSHREDDGNNPARQYGLYFDAFYYAGTSTNPGRKRFTPHIGGQDTASPGYPFNRDYAATARMFPTGSDWHMEAMTYDGQRIIAYVDGVADAFPDFTERSPDSGYSLQQQMDKNPFVFRKGINRSTTPKHFSIGGAVAYDYPVGTTTVHGINRTTGFLGGVAVFNRALTAAEIMQLRLQTLQRGSTTDPIVNLDCYCHSPGGDIPCQWLGWKSLATASAQDFSNAVSSTAFDIYSITSSSAVDFLNRPSGSTEPALAYFPLTGLRLSQVKRITFETLNSTTAVNTRVAINVDGIWYASNTTFATTAAHSDATLWATDAELKTMNVALTAGTWRTLTVQPAEAIYTTLRNEATNPRAASSTGFSVNSGVGGSGSTGSTSTTSGVNGGTARRITFANAPLVASGGLIYTAFETVTPGKQYSYSAYLQCSKQQRIVLRVIYYDGSGQQLAVYNSTPATLAATTLTRMSVLDAPAPDGAVSVHLRAEAVPHPTDASLWANADWLEMSGIMRTAGPNLINYFDGSTGSGAAWTGTTDASAATMPVTLARSLAIAGSATTSDIPNGNLRAVGVWSDTAAGGTTRVSRVKLWAS